ncbi:hypothetical protein CQ034_14940 [Microbacterium sp. MYb45]|nr:hypothetical protein CQ034_14940 [Microbacterium sp. MYb45]
MSAEPPSAGAVQARESVVPSISWERPVGAVGTVAATAAFSGVVLVFVFVVVEFDVPAAGRSLPVAGGCAGLGAGAGAGAGLGAGAGAGAGLGAPPPPPETAAGGASTVES